MATSCEASGQTLNLGDLRVVICTRGTIIPGLPTSGQLCGPEAVSDVTVFCKLERSGWMARIIFNPSLAASIGQQCPGVVPPCRPHASCSAVWLLGPQTSGSPCAGQHTHTHTSRRQSERPTASAPLASSSSPILGLRGRRVVSWEPAV